MAVRRCFKSGSAVVVAIPRDWREALGIGVGTHVVMGLRDKVITIERAKITGEGVPQPVAASEKTSHG